MAMTIDGKVARPDGKWYGLSSRTDKKRMDTYRSQVKGLILGKNSLINDNPIVHLRYESGKDPRPILLIRSGEIDPTKHVFQHSKSKPLIYCTEQNFLSLRHNLGNKADLKKMNYPLEPEEIINDLIKEGLDSLLLEGGPRLNSSFLEKNLVHTIYLTIVPYIIGQGNLPCITNGISALPNFDSEKWILKKTETIENEIFLRYDSISIG
jgi:2,5-diamino-6-(ribosylamino)-4(3H)-pyrimidinone 5'-phosphate reductase